MADNRVVDIEQLESDLTAIGNAIRGKTGGTAALSFPDGMVSEIGTLTDTSVATAAAAKGDILSGKIAYVNGSKITGTMTNNGKVTATLTNSNSYTIPSGYHNGSGTVSITPWNGTGVTGASDALSGTWKLNPSLSQGGISYTRTFEVNVTTGSGSSYTGLRFQNPTSSLTLKGITSSGREYVIYDSGGWTDTEDMNINITSSLSEVEDGDTLLAWLENNGTKPGTQIKYQDSTVATFEGGSITLPVKGKKMLSDIVVASGSGGASAEIRTGTLKCYVGTSNYTVYAPIFQNNSISYQAISSNYIRSTITNVVLNAPFAVDYLGHAGYEIYSPELTNVVQFYNYVIPDQSRGYFAGALESISGELYISRDCCFEANSQILMADGDTKALVDVKIGDMVMTYNEATGATEVNEVTALGSVELASITQITLEDDTIIRMNRYHPMWTEEGWKSLTRYKNLPKLTIDDKLINTNGKYVAIQSIERINIEEETYYTIKVANNNNFYVNGYLAQGKDKD